MLLIILFAFRPARSAEACGHSATKIVGHAKTHVAQRANRGLLLTYVASGLQMTGTGRENFEDFERTLCGVFVRSFIAISSNSTDLVILHEDMRNSPQPSLCAGLKLPSNVAIVAPPPELIKQWKAETPKLVSAPLACYRFLALSWYLSTRAAGKYAYAGHVDADVLFQLDVFDLLFAERAAFHSELHVVVVHEVTVRSWLSPHEHRAWWGKYPHGHCKHMPFNLHDLGLLGDVPGLRKRSIATKTQAALPRPGVNVAAAKAAAAEEAALKEAAARQEAAKEAANTGRTAPRAVPGSGHLSETFWRASGPLPVANVAHVFGTLDAMQDLMRRMAEAQSAPSIHDCMDVGVFALIVYSGALAARTRVVVWETEHGIVQSIAGGSLRDSRGRFVNEHGAPFALVHLFKRNRQPQLFDQFDRMLPSPPMAAWEQTIFPRPLQRVRVLDSRFPNGLHPWTNEVAKKGRVDVSNAQVPVPVLDQSPCRVRYEALSAIGPDFSTHHGAWFWERQNRSRMLAVHGAKQL